jgi:uncharacterized protein YjdB
MNRFRLTLFFCSVALAFCAVGLRAVQSQSANLQRITNTTEEAVNINPSLSGDGRRIAFESTEDLAHTGGNEHFRALRADLSTNAPTFIQMAAARAPAAAISQDGSRIAFAATDNPLGTNADGNSEIFFYDGATLRQITNTAPADFSQRTTQGNFQPSISDDGRLIAFSSNRNLTNQNPDANLEIFIYDTTTAAFTQQTNSTNNVGATDAKLSGNGARLAYIMDAGATPSAQRNLILQDRTNNTTRTLAANMPALALTRGRAISDDGSRIVFAAETAAATSQVFLFDGRNNVLRQITTLDARADDVPLHPSISGDGSRISFATRRQVTTTNTDRSVELYTYDIPTGQFARVTTAPSTATAEVISSLNDDGTLIAFNFPRVLSGAVSSSDFANNSEIYVTSTAARPSTGTLTIFNGASFGNEPSTTNAVAPNSIAVATGGALAQSTQQGTRQPDGTFPRTLGGTIVTVNNRPAQIFYVSPTQVNFLVPPETEIGTTAEVVITNSENFQSRGTINILRAAPGVFTINSDGLGEGLILDADTLMPGPFDPTNGNRRLIVFATGARNAINVTVTVAGRNVTVENIIASSNMPGLDEIHILLPSDLRGLGLVDLVVRADNRDSNPVQLTLTGEPRRTLLINEVLADPPDGAAGDANRDGTRDSTQDEFVELVNNTTTDLDISGYKLQTRSSTATNDTDRNVFAPGTIVPAGASVVIFGGANAATFNANDPAFGGALVQLASTRTLSLTNTGGVVTLRDPLGGVVSLFAYGGSTNLNGDNNQSLTRSPDITGNFTLHQTAAGSNNRAYSPGTRVDGTPFVAQTISRIVVTPSNASIIVGAQQQFTAQAFDLNNQPLGGVIFTWQSSVQTVATIDSNGLATGLSAGTTEIRASARGVISAPALLEVRQVVRILTRIVVTPSNATTPVGGTQRFTARAFDQFDQEITGVTFAFASSNQTVATIDGNGIATALAQGATTITATAQNITGSATLNVVPPTVVINEVLADPPGSVATDLIGDANHDGVRSASDDEFVELVNSTGTSINVSGWTLQTRSLTGTTDTVRHTFAANTTLPAGDAIVVFGGGGASFDPTNTAFGGAQVTKASTGQLSLTNTGLFIILKDADGNVVTQFTYGGTSGLNGDTDQSLTRSPDINGNFVQHTAAAGANNQRFSPGTKVDGTFFAPRAGRLTSITLTPSTVSIIVGQTTQLVAQALDQYGRPLPNGNITFTNSNANAATIDSINADPTTGRATANVTGRNAGSTEIRATTNDGPTNVTSNPTTVNVTPAPPHITRVEIAPLSATINRGNTQQFTASAFDDNNQPVPTATFTWTSSNTAVATVDSNGLALGAGIGTAIITATTSDGIGGTINAQASLTVRVPLVLNELLADPPDGLAGDSNRDGVRDSDNDEFVEVVNNSNAPVDVSGVVIADATANRFTFAPGTTLAPGRAALIFGGGTPNLNDPNFGGALVLTTASLSLNNTADTVTVKLTVAGSDVVIDTFTYGAEADTNQSLTRSPDLSGAFTRHTLAPNSDGRTFSAGTRIDGTPFNSPAITRIEITPAPATIDVGSTQTFNARAFSNASGSEVEIQNVSFIWDSSDSTKATVTPTTGTSTVATGLSAGTTTIRARAGSQQGAASLTINAVVAAIDLTPDTAAINVGGSFTFTATARDAGNNIIPNLTFNFTLRNPTPSNAATITTTTANTVTVRGDNVGTVAVVASYIQASTNTTFEDASTLTMNPAQPRVVRVDVAPTTATISRGATQQFTANAFDANNQIVGNASFTWSSSNPAVATINNDGIATGVGIGSTTITATTSDNAGGTINGTATLNVQVPLVINEFLADPPDGIAGDANRDGVRDGANDEFIELLNNSNAPVDISGVIIADATSNRFTFPANTTLAAGRAVVIFGGGTPPVSDPSFGGALIVTSGGLSLNNTGDTVNVKLPVAGTDINIASQTYGAEADTNQSLTRSPDAEVGTNGGNFVGHTTAPNAATRAYSPGTRTDGTPFNSPAVTRIEVQPASASINIGATQTFTARAFSNASGTEVEIANVSFIWDSSDTAKATVAPTTGASTVATGIAAGTTTIRARAGTQQGTAALTINPPPPILTSVSISPTSATIIAGQMTQFTAQAFDQYGNALNGITITFASSDINVATVDSVTTDATTGIATAIVTGRNAGTVSITANATDGTRNASSNPATLNVNNPPPTITRIDVTPTSATIGAGAKQQFTAHAFDQNNQEITGVTFTWSSSNTSVATIDANGLATGLQSGTTSITASAGSVTSNTATLNVTAAPVPTAGQIIINEAVVAFATSATQTRNDFVELYNTTSNPLDISGLVISFRPSGTSNTPSVVTLPGAMGSGTTLIQPNGYFLIVNGADTFGVAADFNASASSFDLNNTTGGIKIELNSVKIDGLTYQGSATAPNPIFVAYGEGTIFNFTSGTTNDLIRSPNATDTNDNANDFRRNGTVASVSPKTANPTIP